MKQRCNLFGIGGLLLPAAVLGFAVVMLNAAPKDSSDVVGVHRVNLSAGPNFIANPFHRAPAFRGTAQGIAANAITLEGAPGWAADQFGTQDGNFQYIALLRKDASASPGNQGDWWRISGNTADTLTIATESEDLTQFLDTGDEIEIRRLNSIKDLFGTGSSVRLNKDSDGSANSADEDVIYLVSGTSFSSEIFYHDGSLAPEGYYVDGNGPFDGSTLTLKPDEPIMLFRKAGSAVAKTLAAGFVQNSRLTHYLSPGANPVATGFALDAAVGSSGLQEAGWKADSDGSPSATDEDLLYTVSGASFSDELFFHDGSLANPGWYANGTEDPFFPLGSSKGLVLFIQNPAGLRWRQPPPF